MIIFFFYLRKVAEKVGVPNAYLFVGIELLFDCYLIFFIMCIFQVIKA